MGLKSFENFGLAAETYTNATVLASRYGHQKTMEKEIVFDLEKKMSLKRTHTLLDIGCNVGNILFPLSLICKKVVGIDHKNCIKQAKLRFPDANNISYIAGNFFDVTVKNKFDRIVVYSVLQYLKNRNEMLLFVDKVLHLIKNEGIIMLGDIPNKSKEDRFYGSARGKNWLNKFNDNREQYRKKFKVESISDLLCDTQRDNNCVKFDDDSIMQLLLYIRLKGFESYILPQPPGLPFGTTREDIIIHNNKC